MCGFKKFTAGQDSDPVAGQSDKAARGLLRLESQSQPSARLY